MFPSKHKYNQPQMDGDKKQATVFSRKARRHSGKRVMQKLNNRTTMIALAVLLLVVGGVVYWARMPKYSANDLCRRKKTSPIYKEAANVMNPGAIGKLGIVATRISNMKDYEKDPNCMYAVTMYYVGSGDSLKARQAYDKLAQVYVQKDGFSKDYGEAAVPINEIKMNVEYLEKKQTEQLKNLRIDNIEDIKRQYNEQMNR